MGHNCQEESPPEPGAATVFLTQMDTRLLPWGHPWILRFHIRWLLVPGRGKERREMILCKELAYLRQARKVSELYSI